MPRGEKKLLALSVRAGEDILRLLIYRVADEYNPRVQCAFVYTVYTWMERLNLTKQSKREPASTIPQFKSEAEESAWWDRNEDYIVERLKKKGRVVGPLKVKGAPPPTKAISIRIPVDDLNRVQAIAKQQGIPYQTLIKNLVHKAVSPKTMMS
jgi:predicted DNA binding CopG/RHH family protein